MLNNCTKYSFKLLIRSYHAKEVRVRFAPSPTGYLHLGGLRTAIYNSLFAKAHNGKFILRIEDTDQTRVIEGARDQLQKDLNWAGIHLDEGPLIGGNHGPYIQSQRLELYRNQVNKLSANDSAYYCFCSAKRLELLRSQAMRARQIPKYDNRCRYLDKEEIQKKLDENVPYCIRFKLISGCQSFEDLIYGSISYDVALNEGDPIIMKSDGYPTYHFANVVDDHFMNISHVLRGVEWQISTTKHIMMYRAFGWQPPLYGHLPLLLNADGTKLSKRQGDIQIAHYRNSGILPQALVNFITHSGGGFEKDLQRGLKPRSYTMDELTKQFDIKTINSHSGKLMSERLLEFNRLEIERQLQAEDDTRNLVANVQNILKNKFPDRVSDNSLNLSEEYIRLVLMRVVKRINRLSDLVSNQLSFLWIVPKNHDRKAEDDVQLIQKFQELLNEQDDLSKNSLSKTFKSFCEKNNVSFTKLMQLIRSILSGLKEGPSVAEMIEILGKNTTLVRLRGYVKDTR